ncbi:hypothetical protein SIN8267_01795 [Sinobacterium norvegicum]|uniref:DUF72 domain-containing protein n=1 Tax=Sinobacterium norvegicum TaxID=1641715 RepID=A0ABM9AEQ2_9GAMM|nr:DUF72 domain-containing protein [Sinobacterium norvegicum]CAH0991683.1 hypothetical protein SIN8267_01795 [Sinobacterium norvegicum]
MAMQRGRFYIGMPQWSSKHWFNTVYPPATPSSEYLYHYSRVFNAVEGNTTFYSLPSIDTVTTWDEQTEDGFHFNFKLPKSVTHEAGLQHCQQQTSDYFKRLAPLADKLGVFMLQLPANFSPEQLPLLQQFLTTLPQGLKYSVEVRHPAFFQKGEAEKRLNRMLFEAGVDRVMFDSRALFACDDLSEEIIEAKNKKPRLPVHAVALANNPMIRFIGHPQISDNGTFFAPWCQKISAWLAEGRDVSVFFHTADNRLAPQLAMQMLSTIEWQPQDFKLQLLQVPQQRLF